VAGGISGGEWNLVLQSAFLIIFQVAEGLRQFLGLVLEGAAAHPVDLPDIRSSPLDGPLDSSRAECTESAYDRECL